MRFTLRQLHYFIAAGDAGSIRQASENICVSQPSISAAISQLESEFAVQLFIRHHAQGLSLTGAGKLFLREARQFLSHGHELEQMASDLSGAVAGRLNVVCFSPLAPFMVADFCHRFAAENSAVNIEVSEADQAEILAQLHNGSADIALTYDLDLPADLQFEPLLSLPPYVVLASDHPLATREKLNLRQLCKWPLVLIDLPLSREYFLSLFTQRNLKPDVLTRTRQSDVMRGLVGQGYGYGLANVRPRNRTTLDGNKLVYIPLEGKLPALSMGLLSFTHTRRNRVVEAFVSHAQALVASGQIPGMDLQC